MTQKSVYLETFGCQMNELDSELVVGQLAGLGYRFTTDSGAADVVLYNTCSVRERAEQKVWSRLGEMKKAKKTRPGLVVGVLGCMAERDGTDLINRMPVVDILCGPGELDKLPGLLDNAVRTRLSFLGEELGNEPSDELGGGDALRVSPSREQGEEASPLREQGGICAGVDHEVNDRVPLARARGSFASGDDSLSDHEGQRGHDSADQGGVESEDGRRPERERGARAAIDAHAADHSAAHARGSLGTLKTAQAVRTSARQVALQGNTSRRSATLSAAADSLEMLDLTRSISPADPVASADGSTKFSAYVRITRGCNKFCTYCVVPFTRGAEVHRPPEHIVDECKRLADAGVIEITLLGQTVNHYRFEHGSAVSLNGIVQPQKGRAFKGGHRRDPLAGERVTTFADLLARIHDEVPAIRRLRFVTSYPRDFGDDVMEVMRDHPRICRYVHVPAQTGSDRMLKMMNRGYTIAEYDEFIDRCRGYLHQPEIGRPLMLSGDIIVGFPTETDADFEATVGLLERSRYKNCFIFKYSPRPGTVAYDKIPDDVPEAVKRERNNRLLAVQAEISSAISAEQVGGEFDVLFEGHSRAERKKRGTDVKPGTGMVALTVSMAGSALDGADDRGAFSRAASGNAPEGGPSAGEGSGPACGLDASSVLTLDAPSETGPTQLAGRTDGDLIVHVDVPESANPDGMIGTIRRVRITGGSGLSLTGELV